MQRRSVVELKEDKIIALLHGAMYKVCVPSSWTGKRISDQSEILGRRRQSSHLPRAVAQDTVIVDREAGALAPAGQDGLGRGGNAAGLARHHLRSGYQRIHQLLVVPRLLNLHAPVTPLRKAQTPDTQGVPLYTLSFFLT